MSNPINRLILRYINMVKKRKYTPIRQTNPVVLRKKIDKLQEDIEDYRHILSAVAQSNERHMEHLANFAKHDMGNAIQNLYATMTIWQEKIDSKLKDELKTSLNNLNSTLEHFGQLIPSNVNDSFALHQLMDALCVLTRSQLQVNGIQFDVVYNRSDKTLIRHSFQPLLQMLHNLVINSIKSFIKSADSKIIRIEAGIKDSQCLISIKDNGCGIDDSIKDKIYKYGFTTTGGNGIGLAHAAYLCEEIGGSIRLERNIQDFSTIFTIKFPIQYDTEKDNRD